MGTLKIYGLLSSKYPHIVKYIGITNQKLPTRLKQHLARIDSKGHGKRKNNWIKNTLKQGENILIRQLDTAESLEELGEKEITWVNFFKQNQSEELTNFAEPGLIPSPPKKKIVVLNLKGEYIKTCESVLATGKEFSVKTGNIISICKKARVGRKYIFLYEEDYLKNPNQTYINYSKQCSEITKNNWKNPEFRDKLNNQKKKNISAYDKKDKLIKSFNSVQEASEHFNITRGYISSLLTNSRKSPNYNFKYNK